ncbi:MAG: hypothetical protein IPO08_01300 [Xanthomonadales bacterium]|nr:hypothetical protein [Xanthomonadales bacterium]
MTGIGCATTTTASDFFERNQIRIFGTVGESAEFIERIRNGTKIARIDTCVQIFKNAPSLRVSRSNQPFALERFVNAQINLNPATVGRLRLGCTD